MPKATFDVFCHRLTSSTVAYRVQAKDAQHARLLVEEQVMSGDCAELEEVFLRENSSDDTVSHVVPAADVGRRTSSR